MNGPNPIRCEPPPCPRRSPTPNPNQRESAAREPAGEDEGESEGEDEGVALAADRPRAFEFAVGDGPRQPLFNFMAKATAADQTAGAADAAAADAETGGADGVSARMGPQETQVPRELIGRTRTLTLNSTLTLTLNSTLTLNLTRTLTRVTRELATLCLTQPYA